MSVNIQKGQFKPALNGLHNKLQSALQSEAEWKEVAENRKFLLCTLDKHIDKMIKGACKIQGIFGVEADQSCFPTSHISTNSGLEIFRICLLKITALETFMARLTTEALEVQDRLQGVLEIAIEALPVSRPTSDLSIPQDLTTGPDDRLSPIDEEFPDVVAPDNDLDSGDTDDDNDEHHDLTSALIAMKGLQG